ncbi:MAG TPA: phosphate acyltransferase PlsX [Kofleriaceae bacterium]|nr:phosphate acyltransferase PlsX [Kofleriaceae bacterium]
MRVVVDGMGSDRAPGPEVLGALRAVRAQPLEVILVGDQQKLEEELLRAGRTPDDKVSVVHASQVVTFDDHPAQAFRRKPDSSMRVAVSLVADGKADAVVSAGNSGAALAYGLFLLGRILGVERPAIVTVLPTPSGPLVLCDSGANTEPKPAQLAQFGLLAVAYDRAVHGRARPRLGLLSNGSEPGKGTPLTRAAHELLTAAERAKPEAFDYVGYVEGSEVFAGVVDVIATDGFTGNIVLKTCEGIAESLFGLVRQEIEAELGAAAVAATEPALARLGGAIAPALAGVAKRIDYAEIGGALLAGVQKPVVIAHGRSDATAIGNAIQAAARFAEQKLPEQLAQALKP